MLEETTIIKSKAIFSDDKEHRLLLRKEWNNEKGFLTDTCLTAQDKYKAYLDYFRIGY